MTQLDPGTIEDHPVAQVRKVVTELPGPRSIELEARRAEAVAPGVSSVMPVYVDRADGAILVDVDGNALIDLGSGIAVVSVGHAAPAVVEAVRAPGGPVHPHLLHGQPLRGVRGGVRGAQRADAG